MKSQKRNGTALGAPGHGRDARRQDYRQHKQQGNARRHYKPRVFFHVTQVLSSASLQLITMFQSCTSTRLDNFLLEQPAPSASLPLADWPEQQTLSAAADTHGFTKEHGSQHDSVGSASSMRGLQGLQKPS